MRQQVTTYSALGAQVATIIGIIGVIGTLSYNYLVGSNETIVVLFFLSVALWVAAIVIALALSRRNRQMLLDQLPAERALDRRSQKLMWLGFIFCALPIPWFYLLSGIGKSSSHTAPEIIYGLPLLFLFVGIALIVYRSYVRWTLVKRLLHKTSKD
jgi:MFS family permease